MITQEISIFFSGFLIGICSTFIPIHGVMVVSHFLSKKAATAGLASSFGMICAQLIWTCIGWGGLLFVKSHVPLKDPYFILIGSLILFVLAAKTYHQQEHIDIQRRLKPSFHTAFCTGFFLSFSFPTRILGYFSLFSILEVPTTTPILHTSFVLIGGLLLGSIVFWLCLLLSMLWKKEGLSPKQLQQLHKVSATIFMGFIALGLFKVYI